MESETVVWVRDSLKVCISLHIAGEGYQMRVLHASTECTKEDEELPK